MRRKPLRETTRVNSTVQSDGEYVQLNQYKLEQPIGQVCNHFSYQVKTSINSLWKIGLQLQLHNGRWKPDPSCISNKKYAPSPRDIMGVQRSEIKCRIQTFMFRTQLLTCLWVREINVHFLCTFSPFLPVFGGFFKDNFT